MSNWDNSNGWAPPPPPAPPPNNQWQPSQPSATPHQTGGGFFLGPLTVADVLDLTFALLKKCWKKLVIAVLVYAVPAGILSGISSAIHGSHSPGFGNGLGSFVNLFGGNTLSGAEEAAVLLVGLLTLIVYLTLHPFVIGAITRLIAAEYLGREMSTKEAFDGVRKLYWRFVGASLLVFLSACAGLLFFVVPGIAIWVLFTAVTPVIAIEEDTATNAMGRSWALMKRRFWSYLAITIVMFIISYVASLIIEIVPVGIALVFYAVHLSPIGGLFVAAADVLASLVSLPITAIVATLIYFDARVRNEGFDLQMMANSTSPPQSPAPPSPPHYPQYPQYPQQ